MIYLILLILIALILLFTLTYLEKLETKSADFFEANERDVSKFFNLNKFIQAVKNHQRIYEKDNDIIFLQHIVVKYSNYGNKIQISTKKDNINKLIIQRNKILFAEDIQSITDDIQTLINLYNK